MEKYMIEMTKKHPGHRDIKDYFDVGKINPIGMEPSHRTRLVHYILGELEIPFERGWHFDGRDDSLGKITVFDDEEGPMPCIVFETREDAQALIDRVVEYIPPPDLSGDDHPFRLDNDYDMKVSVYKGVTPIRRPSPDENGHRPLEWFRFQEKG